MVGGRADRLILAGQIRWNVRLLWESKVISVPQGRDTTSRKRHLLNHSYRVSQSIEVGEESGLVPMSRSVMPRGHTTKTGRKRSRILYSQESVTSTLLPRRVTTSPKSLLAGDQVFKPLSLQGHSTSSTELGSTPL